VLVVVSVVLLLAIGYAMWPKSVPPPPQPTAAELDDRRILQEVNRVLDSSSAVRKHDIGVRVENGVCDLEWSSGDQGRIRYCGEPDVQRGRCERY